LGVAEDVEVGGWMKTWAVVTTLAGGVSCDFKRNQVIREGIKVVRGWIKSSHHGSDLFLRYLNALFIFIFAFFYFYFYLI